MNTKKLDEHKDELDAIVDVAYDRMIDKDIVDPADDKIWLWNEMINDVGALAVKILGYDGPNSEDHVYTEMCGMIYDECKARFYVRLADDGEVNRLDKVRNDFDAMAALVIGKAAMDIIMDQIEEYMNEVIEAEDDPWTLGDVDRWNDFMLFLELRGYDDIEDPLHVGYKSAFNLIKGLENARDAVISLGAVISLSR